MRHYSFTDDKTGVTFARCTKKEAREAWRAGFIVMLCPVKARPFGFWHLECITNVNRCEGEQFETFLNQYEAYNCGYNELGKYPAYYLPVNDANTFERTAGESNPYSHVLTNYNHEAGAIYG